MKRITAWAAVLTLTLSLLTGCAQIDESSADELPFPVCSRTLRLGPIKMPKILLN